MKIMNGKSESISNFNFDKFIFEACKFNFQTFVQIFDAVFTLVHSFKTFRNCFEGCGTEGRNLKGRNKGTFSCTQKAQLSPK